MGDAKLTQQMLFLIEPEKAKLLAELAKETGVNQSTLLRRALDQLLVRYGKLPAAKKRKP